MSFLLQTDRTDFFKIAFDSIKSFIREATLEFNERGFSIVNYDNAGILLVNLVVSAQKIVEMGGIYQCETPGQVTFNTKSLFQALKHITQTDQLKISLCPTNKTPPVICVETINRHDGKRLQWEIVVPKKGDVINFPGISQCKFAASILLDVNIFNNMIKNLTSTDATHVRIECSPDLINFSAKGIINNVVMEIAKPARHQSQEEKKFFEPLDNDSSWPIAGVFDLKVLNNIAKAKGISRKILIYVKKDSPFAFSYETHAGALNFLISPCDFN